MVQLTLALIKFTEGLAQFNFKNILCVPFWMSSEDWFNADWDNLNADVGTHEQMIALFGVISCCYVCSLLLNKDTQDFKISFLPNENASGNGWNDEVTENIMFRMRLEILKVQQIFLFHFLIDIKIWKPTDFHGNVKGYSQHQIFRYFWS